MVVTFVRPCESLQVIAGGFAKISPSEPLSQRYRGSCVTATEGDHPNETVGKLGGPTAEGGGEAEGGAAVGGT